MKIRGQIWVETVLYTLIGLALIGLALGFIMPKINEARDRALVEQAINTLSELDNRITETIQTGAGNVRQAEFLMKKGEMYINASSNNVFMVLSGLTKPYSEPGVEIFVGRVVILSEVGQKTSTIYLKLAYNANLTYLQKDEDRKFTPASTPYKLYISNRGSLNNQIWIDFEEVSDK